MSLFSVIADRGVPGVEDVKIQGVESTEETLPAAVGPDDTERPRVLGKVERGGRR